MYYISYYFHTFSSILEEAGTLIEDGFDIDIDEEVEAEKEVVDEGSNYFSSLSLKELEKKLKETIENEDYETASKIRDELKKRKP